jgi:hypothetical protein
MACTASRSDRLDSRTVRVIGFEGGNKSPVTWGAAAIEVDGVIYNAVSGRVVSPEEYEEYVSNGVVSSIPEPIEVRGRGPYIVLKAADGELPFLCRYTLQRTCWGQLSSAGSDWFVFRSLDAFTLVADRAVLYAMFEVFSRGNSIDLTRPFSEPDRLLLRTALVLYAHHPELLALLGSVTVKGQGIRADFVEAMMSHRPAPDRERFDRFRSLLSRGDLTCEDVLDALQSVVMGIDSKEAPC